MLNYNPYNLYINSASIDVEEAEEKVLVDRSIPTAIVLNSFAVIFSSTRGSLTFDRTHGQYEFAKTTALKYLDTGLIPESVYIDIESKYSKKAQLVSWSNDRLEIRDNTVIFDGDEVPSEIEKHLLSLFEADPNNLENSLEAWSKFISKLRDAMDIDIHNRLFAFLAHNDLTIDKDGDVLAWKVVRNNYKDIHSGTIDNSVGTEPTMPRIKVNNNPNQTCSYGLHACAFGYLNSFGSNGNPVMIVKIDVRDIVSVPVDYNGQKIRVCKYKVVAEAGKWGTDVTANSNPHLILKKAFA